jgi:hypothetical protein
MKFPTITIPDPEAVGKWLDQEQPMYDKSSHAVAFRRGKFEVEHWVPGCNFYRVAAFTPSALLEDIRAKLAAHDPLAKLRAEAAKAKYVLVKMPTD